MTQENNAMTYTANSAPQMQQMPEQQPMQPVVQEDPRVKVLSTGVKVRFGTIPQALRQTITVNVFSGQNMRDGELVTDESNENALEMAERIMNYNSALISWGVELVGSISDYIAQGVTSKKWEKQLINSGLVDEISDQDDREFYFLRYIAFASEDDWALLSQMLMTE